MIEINLVPEQLRKKRKSKAASLDPMHLAKEKLLGIVAGFVVLLLVISIFLQLIIFIQFARFKGLKSKWEKISPDKQNVDRIITELRGLQGKIKPIEELTADQGISWSQKLNNISDSVPRGVWLRRIFLKDKELSIEGSAVSKSKDEIILVHSFAANLKNQGSFLKDFTGFDVDSIQRQKVQTLDLADFIIKAKLK